MYSKNLTIHKGVDNSYQPDRRPGQFRILRADLRDPREVQNLSHGAHSELLQHSCQRAGQQQKVEA